MRHDHVVPATHCRLYGDTVVIRPITKNQFLDLWLSEFMSRDGHHCALCGNHGIIDTRDKIFTSAGVECGNRLYCICPNGRQIKKCSKVLTTKAP